MFSIIVPLYNKGAKVRRTIDSVLAQTWQGEWECVVVDDGSTDDSAQYVREYADPKIHYLRKDNGGVSSARNFGILHSRKEWLIFLDADDELLPDALSLFARMIASNPQGSLFVGGLDWNGKKGPESRDDGHRTPFPFFDMWLGKFYPCPRNMAIRRSLLAEGPRFDERMSFFEDLDFSLRVVSVASVVYSRQCVARYNQDGEGLSAKPHRPEAEMAYYIPESLSLAKSFWHRALLFENLEMQILWWKELGEAKQVSFYKEMQERHFSRLHPYLHWIRQHLLRYGII